MQKRKLFLISIALLLACGTAAAQEETENITAESLNIEEPTLLPSSPFYFLKNWGREVQSFFTFNEVKKAELRERFANEKIIELKKITEEEAGSEIIEKAAENYKKEIENIKNITENIKETAQENNEVGKFLDKFIQQQTLHQTILQKLEEQVPEEVLEKITEAREAHIEKFGEVMTKLENKENIQERLETNLKKVQSSEFQNFKNLEILKNLEEKIDESAKEAVKNVRTGLLTELKEQVMEMTAEKIEEFKEYTENVGGVKEKKAEIMEELQTQLQNQPAIMQKLMEIKENIIEKINIENEESGSCITLWDPVCGTDGKTYSNKCFAELAGVSVAREGECGETEQKFNELKELNIEKGLEELKELNDEAGNLLEKNIIEPIKQLVPQQLMPSIEVK